MVVRWEWVDVRVWSRDKRRMRDREVIALVLRVGCILLYYGIQTARVRASIQWEFCV